MRTVNLCFWSLLAVAPYVFADSPPVQGSASSTSGTEVSANRNGASAANGGAGAASASTKRADANAAGSSEIGATLTKPVDAGKAKPGDPVTATSDSDAKSADGTNIKRGSKLLGHVTKAQPVDKSTSGNAEGSAGSQLGILFDKAVLKNGQEVPLNATIQAISTAESTASFGPDIGPGPSMVGGGSGSGRAGGGGLIGGLGGSVAGSLGAAGGVVGGVGHGVSTTVGGMAGGTLHSAGAVGGLTSSGALTSGSQGVFGTRDLNLAPSSTGSADGSVITSPKRNVHLDGGTRMLLSNSVGSSAGASGAGPATSSASKTEPAQGSSGHTPPTSHNTHEPTR